MEYIAVQQEVAYHKSFVLHLFLCKPVPVLNSNAFDFSFSDENCASVKSKRKDGIFEDPVPLFKKQKTFVTVSVQTDIPCSTTMIAEALSKSRKALSINDMASSTSQADRTIDMLTSGK